MKIRFLSFFILSSFFFLLLAGAGCSPTPIAQIPLPNATPPTTSWQTYTDTVRGFSLRYPGDKAVNITTDPVVLPQAVGGKQRQLKVDVSMKDKAPLDAQGCLIWGVPSVSRNYFSINGQSFCEMVVDEGAAGSTYRTYHYTTVISPGGPVQNSNVIDFQMTIRFPTSVRIYSGCENDADQAKQECIDLAFDATRDADLFRQIMDTFAILPSIVK